MNVSLPEPIATYFRAKGNDDVDEVIACFSPTAVVVDEGESAEMVGLESIRKWMSGTVAGYKLSTKVTNCVEQDGQTIVTALVSGNFPGSPIEFDYHFEVREGKIDRLVIL